MKYVLNKCFGGFNVNETILKELGYKYNYEINPDDEGLIKLIEERGSEAIQGRSSMLKVVDIPDEAADWIKTDYDGIEQIIYALNGKLNFI